MKIMICSKLNESSSRGTAYNSLADANSLEKLGSDKVGWLLSAAQVPQRTLRVRSETFRDSRAGADACIHVRLYRTSYLFILFEGVLVFAVQFIQCRITGLQSIWQER